jgi:CheY-like chemotaxis protein
MRRDSLGTEWAPALCTLDDWRSSKHGETNLIVVLTAEVGLVACDLQAAQREPDELLKSDRQGSGPARLAMPGAKRLVLVVEDEAALQKLVRRRAEQAGLEVLPAGTLDEGFALAAAEKPDLVLLDLHLPDGNGIALLERLKNDLRTSHIDVIVWSGSDGAVGEEDALRAGAIAYFEKADVSLVIAEIARLVDAGRSRDG